MKNKKQESSDDMNSGRTHDFARNNTLESVLRELNAGVSTIMAPPYVKPKYPTVFVVGAPRSGTTLMMQWLAASGNFCYPSNLIARFFGNPYFGARVQQALHTYEHTNQFFNNETIGNYSSDLGRTAGPLAPSEFWYFWRQYISSSDNDQYSDEQLASIDQAGIAAGLAGLEAAFDLPVVTKAMNLNWNLSFLAKIFPQALFVCVKRDLFQNAQSLLFARERFFNDRNRWYSFKPPEYEQLIKGNCFEQVVGQVFHTQQAVKSGIDQIGSDRAVWVDYEDFCSAPGEYHDQIKRKMQTLGHSELKAYAGLDSFKNSSSVRLSPAEVSQVQKAIDHYVPN